MNPRLWTPYASFINWTEFEEFLNGMGTLATALDNRGL